MAFKTKIYGCLRACLLAGFVILASAPQAARAQSANFCYLNNPFTTKDYQPFAVPRVGHKHKGNDMFYCEGTNVPIQSGAPAAGGEAHECDIQVNGAGNPIWMNGGGYGLYMRFNCGNQIETRYAHLQGYNANTHSAIVGRTGNAWTTPPHVHYEIYVQGEAVDPECAYGIANPKNKCPAGLPPGPQNLCDPNIVRILHDDARRKLSPSPLGTSMSIGPSQPASTFTSGIYGDPCSYHYKGGAGQCSDPAKQCEKVEVPNNTPINAQGQPIDMGDEGDWNPEGDTTEGTGILTGTGEPVDSGDAGGDTSTGTGQPDAEIPPLTDGNGIPNSSCGVDTMVAMTNQSVMEARRETEMNKRMIAKADSVLEYGCLPFYLKKTENELAGIFSETDRWVNNTVDLYGATHTINKTLGTMSMDSALVNVIWSAQMNYKQNFNHPMMGGLEGYSQMPEPEACKDMQKVWDAAKCQNFPGPDKVFLTFQQMINKDPREFPTATCNRTGINQGMIDAAKNKATRYDKVAPKFDYLGTDGDCKPPIPTGITVYRHKDGGSGSYVSSVATYADGVCSNAGCHYDNPGLSGTGSCEKD